MAKRGPQSKEAKLAVRHNAVKHGIMSITPVIPGIETEEDWEGHVQGMIDSYEPANHHETVLIERMALLLWRMNRISRYEHESIISTRHEYVENLAEIEAEMEKEKRSAKGRVRSMIDLISDDDTKSRFRRYVLPYDFNIATILRYESHLHRQYIQTKRELEASQAQRKGREAPLARLDISGDFPADGLSRQAEA